MTIANDDVLKVTARLNWAGAVTIQNVFWFRLDAVGGCTDEDAVDDIAARLEGFYGAFLSYIPNVTAFEDILIYNYTTDVLVDTAPWPSLTVGGSSSDPLPSGVAAVLTAYTAIKKVRGRKFLPFFDETTTSNGLLTSATMITLASALATYVSDFTGSVSGEHWEAGIVRRATGVFVAFREGVVRNVLGYQRRRKFGVGS